jgi:nitrite reductase (NADH) small subunit
MAETLAGTVSDFEDGTRRIVSVEGTDVGVFRHGGEFFAFENRCLHQGGPVCEGILIPRVEAVLGPRREARGERFSDRRQHIVCPWHGWEYDIRTGRCAADRRLRLRAYDVRCRDDKVYVVA